MYVYLIPYRSAHQSECGKDVRQLAEKQHTARMNSIIRAVLCGNVCLLLSHIRLTALPMRYLVYRAADSLSSSAALAMSSPYLAASDSSCRLASILATIRA